MKLFILLLMIFLHIWDDFGRQGIMASMKQRSWWLKQDEFHPMYMQDYLMALFMHSFSWAFMIMLPIFFLCRFEVTGMHLAYFICNLFIHMIVDDAKANVKCINLITDQTIHICQIALTWMVFVM